MAVSGPEFAQVFTARLTLGDGDTVIGTADASSKRKAQLAAAAQGWKALDDPEVLASLQAEDAK